MVVRRGGRHVNLIMIVVLLVVITVVATVLIGRNGDANYSKATKGILEGLR